ncbi:biotin--[acetyl-CoA-carboxylase] ligase [Thiothrix lacustris]|jgi:BirA family biotin operon repressor/biotin-[acetyl-CoA-carboxylase] ligase|uniref:biotin--[biotin carboxyl-carrier protein] ligase n=1 Tax=Thiothrix lacustris TaxID=525917 RepID=A0ABY9MNU4_9GAMM|nr:biotin--[acetyl-CoA-carboxylase] ligase [Thiothrix lacustris]WML89901.1 biotin--[acetyl-CoA-carboxylase] ligase [Thiothrix lacustris]
MLPITEPLQASEIRRQLDSATLLALNDIHVFPELDSTNRWALQQGVCGDVCLAEQQSAGRGRRGRQWQSPSGVNVYLSIRWCFTPVPEHLPLLSLVTGLAVAEALEDCAIHGHGLKWPNDVYYDGKKLGGILLEAVGSLEQVVIGIGLNVNMLPEAGAEIDQPWTSLQQIAGKPVERNVLVSAVLQRLLKRLRGFSRLDMAQFQQDWRQRDVLLGRQVQAFSGTETLQGLASGINNQGQLIINFSDGSIRNLSSADVSVRM